MITYEVIDAIDLMALMVEDPKHIAGIMAVREMLGDFDYGVWGVMSESERKEMMKDYLP